MENSPYKIHTMEVVKDTPEYKRCVYHTEKPLFITAFILSLLVWLIGGIFVIWYLPFILIFLIAMQAIFLSHIKGYGIKISEKQFPEIYKLAQKSATKLGMHRTPEVYLYNMDGMFNAFATHFFSRNFVILTTAIVDACEEDKDYLSFVLTHEFTHLQRGHTRWQGFLAPSRLLPWIGKAYSKACEYTCDAVGATYGLDGNFEKSKKAVSLLATASRKRSDRLNFNAFDEEQRKNSGSFWMTLAETNATHPYTFKRVANLQKLLTDQPPEKVRGSFWGRFLAPMFSITFIIWIYVIFIILVASGGLTGWMMHNMLQDNPDFLSDYEEHTGDDYQDTDECEDGEKADGTPLCRYEWNKASQHWDYVEDREEDDWVYNPEREIYDYTGEDTGYYYDEEFEDWYHRDGD
jgi:Zn-dependent protease with chaperone function